MSKINESLTALANALRARNYSTCTLQNYGAAVAGFLRYAADMPKGKTPAEYVQGYAMRMKSEGREASTINLALAAIRFFFAEVRKTPITIEDVPRLKQPKVLPGVFSQDEIQRILAAPMNPKHLLFLMMVYGCGLRVGEAVRIKAGDLHLDRGLLYLRGKGQKDRVVSIADLPADLLNGQLYGKGQGDYLFESQGTKDHICKRTASKILEHACQKAGVVTRCNIHKLRHSFATHLLEQGTDMSIIQKILGHENIKTTMIYAKVSNELLTKVRSPLAKVIGGM
jgi:site-specific recombinase XerD